MFNAPTTIKKNFICKKSEELEDKAKLNNEAISQKQNSGQSRVDLIRFLPINNIGWRSYNFELDGTAVD